MNSVSSDRLVIFSKSAEAEKVKTRMRPLLSPEQCLTLHLSLLKDTIYKARDFSAVLYMTGSGSLPFDPGIPVQLQQGSDLGERMLNALKVEFQHHSKIVIIGTDSPTLPLEWISNAFHALDQHDVVLGPCEDGGYYLAGMRKLLPVMFHDIEWGTSRVLKKTIQNLAGQSYFLLDRCFDIDLPQDLSRLRKELDADTNGSRNDVKHTRAWITDYFASSAR